MKLFVSTFLKSWLHIAGCLVTFVLMNSLPFESLFDIWAVKGKASVKINEEKPGKGNFVVRVSGRDAPVVELLALKRPFPALKQLDMDQVCQDVWKACQEE